MNASLWETWERIAPSHVLVLGDIILDRYTWGDAERISPEAPVPVLRIDAHEARLGGAGSVAALLRGLAANVTLAGIVGYDPEGRTVQKILDDSQIDRAAVLIDRDRPTTRKERFIGRVAGRHPHQMLRVDREVRTPIAADSAQQLLNAILPKLEGFDVVLISDYGKGVCTPEFLRQLIAAAREKDLPVIVDPARGTDWSIYRGSTLLKPNRLEAQEASGLAIQNRADALRAARVLFGRFEFPNVLVTLDRDGMALATSDGVDQIFGTQARSVYDITGAGDMVLAVLGIGIAGDLSLVETIRLANAAAGLEIERSGVTPITRRELAHELQAEPTESTSKIVELDEMLRLVTLYRQQGKTIVLTNGCFDLLHVGHLTLLQEAARQGDVLIVAINSDASVRQLKGPSRPVITEKDRAGMLAGLSCVDHVLIFGELTPQRLLELLHPDVLVKGGTYVHETVVGHDIVQSHGGRIHIAEAVPRISTTDILGGLLSRPQH